MSLLIERFAAAKDDVRPGLAEDEVVKCVAALRRRGGLRAMAVRSLEPFLALRNITDVAIDDGLNADGALVPLGEDFRAGFRMVLRRDLPEGRINFTVAHEICHTFFYERVPEIKFTSCAVDQEEERLCNCGAEEMLMPTLDVKRCARNEAVSLDVLEMMAARYRVSVAAALIRLRRLGLWRAELFLWQRLTNGAFAVKRAWGSRLVDWQWIEPEIPRKVLSAPAESVISGGTIWRVGPPECQRTKALSFQAKRHGKDLLVLVINKFKKSPALVMGEQQELFTRPAMR